MRDHDIIKTEFELKISLYFCNKLLRLLLDKRGTANSPSPKRDRGILEEWRDLGVVSITQKNIVEAFFQHKSIAVYNSSSLNAYGSQSVRYLPALP